MSIREKSSLEGVLVAIFEARQAGPLADLVTRHRGIPLAAPSLREIPVRESPEIADFGEKLIAGEFDVVIFETGVGFRYLMEALADRLPASGWVAALARTRVVVRGPKPASAIREFGAKLDFQVPEPNTWRETLALLDAKLPVKGLRVAVQEYGKPIPELTEGLEHRGATVTRVAVYRWAFPEDTEPLRGALKEIIAGNVGVALFTAAQQVEHVLQAADSEGCEAALREALATRVVVGSIGPTTSEALRANRLPIDIEPEHPKSGHLVAAVAARWREVGKARRFETGNTTD